jgi:hypothetical protein
MSPILRVFIGPDQLYPGHVVTYADVVTLAARLNRREALEFLGYLNLLISSAATETHLTDRLEPVRDVQTWVFREVVGARLLADLKAKFGHASLLDRPILHRTQILLAIRLVATHGDSRAGNMLAVRDDFDAIGELLFSINALFRTDSSPSKAATPLWVATQMGPIYETENPPPLELSWPRIQELLLHRLPEAATNPAEIERLEQIAVFTTGFSLEAWIDLTWMLFSVWAGVTFRDLMSDRTRGYLDLDAPHEVISAELLTRAVQGIGRRFEELPAELAIDTFSRSTLFDLTVFRAAPLWLMPNRQVLCLDAALLMERLGPHVFWSVMNALDSEERRRQFTSTWGKAFENYCLDGFRGIFRAKNWSYVPNAIETIRAEELADAVASRGGTAIVIECKGTFIRSADKYSGVPRRFFRGLTKKFGRVKHGGVYQLARGIARIWFDGVSQDAVAQPNAVSDVFPILVVQDPIVGCGPVARVLSDRLQVAIQRASRSVNHKVPRVWPLTVITADDLDRLSISIEMSNHRLDSILKRFHRQHPSRMISFGEFLSSRTAGEFRLTPRAQAAIRTRFRRETLATMKRLRDGHYGSKSEPSTE